MANVIVDIKDVNKIYGTNHVVKDLNLQVEEGEFLTLLGSSGCGKTTTLRMIAGFEEPTTGSIQVEGEPIEDKEPFERNVNTVFQSYALFPHKTIYDNVAYGLKMKKVPKKEIKERVTEMLEMVQLSGFEKRYPSQLSGGQKQRVAIARALASDPQILLCDEATSALDPQTTSSILELLKDINQRFGITIVVITHQMAVVREICNQVAIMKDGQVVEYGRTIDIFNHPKSEVARELLQKDEGNATEPKSLKTTDRIKNGTRIRIVYTENSAFEPVIANMILTFKEPVNILKAATKNVGGVAKGEMILELPKGSTNVAAMEQYLKERGLELEELSNNVDGGEEHVDRAN